MFSYLFTLPYEIDFNDQKSIIDYTYKHSNSWSGQVQIWDDEKNTYNPDSDYFGRVQIRGISQASLERFKQMGNPNLNWINWACRLDSETEWEWKNTPITPIVKNVIDSIDHLFVKLHRVLILVQKVGSEIPLHTDKVIKNNYEDGFFAPGPAYDLNIKKNDLHKQNRYMAIKWPLTEILGNNGRPVVEIEGKKYIYDVGKNVFLINEVEVKHGAEAVNHRRGVIFIDGIFNWKNIEKEEWKIPLLTEI